MVDIAFEGYITSILKIKYQDRMLEICLIVFRKVPHKPCFAPLLPDLYLAVNSWPITLFSQLQLIKYIR